MYIYIEIVIYICVCVCIYIYACIYIISMSVCPISTSLFIFRPCLVVYRCSVLQCVAVCCSVLQCVAVCCSVLQCGVEKDLLLSYTDETSLYKHVSYLCHVILHQSYIESCVSHIGSETFLTDTIFD